MTLLAAIASGLLLFLSDHPVRWWGLQFVALAPFWWALTVRRSAERRLWPIGWLVAAANVVPLVVCAGPAPPILAAMAAVLVQWPVVAVLAGRLLTRGAVLGPLAAAAVVALGEVAIWYLVPMFGTAQSSVRPLSAAPTLVAFVAYTGVGGLVFAVAAVQALAVSALVRRGRARWGPLSAIAGVLAIVAALDAARVTRPLGPAVRLAATGWSGFPGSRPDAIEHYARRFEAAAGEHARVLVTPETGTTVGVDGWGLGPRDAAIAALSELSRRHDLFAVVGVFHNPTNDNRAWFVDPLAGLVGEYRKAHLIPWLEDYTAGDGALVVADVAGAKLGAVICQDDNFTDVARAYGREGVQVLAVPTNDWAAIREYHLENSIYRALENGYAMVRGTSNGVSAIVSPRGEVVSRHDHVRHGDGVTIVSTVRVGDGVPTVYARLGDLPIAALCAGLLLVALARRRRPAPDAGAP